MAEKYSILNAKAVTSLTAIGFDYLSITPLTDEERKDMGIPTQPGVKTYYFAVAGSRAADEQHRAIHEYAGVPYKEEKDEDWTDLPIGSDELNNLLGDASVRVYVQPESFEEDEER